MLDYRKDFWKLRIHGYYMKNDSPY